MGLEIGKLIRTPALGLVGELMRNAPTLGEALIDFASYHHRNSRGGVVYVFKSEHEAFFGYGVYQPNVAAHQVICDVVAMAAYNLVAELVGNYQTRHLEALLSRSAPLDLGPYVEAFGEKLKFDQAQTAVRLSHKMLDLPIKNSDAELRKSLEQRLQEKNVLGDLDTLSELRRAVRVGLLQGHSSAIEISMQMRLGKRTLQRRLDEYGIGFQQLLDESRCEFTQQLLANTKLEVSEIANIVGYGDPSVLTRSFTRLDRHLSKRMAFQSQSNSSIKVSR